MVNSQQVDHRSFLAPSWAEAGALAASVLHTRNEPANVHILVVDNENVARESLAQRLREEGFTASTAADGVAALAEAKRRQPDLLVTDLTMPAMGGVELCRQLREVDPYLPVIIVTAHGDPPSAIAGLQVGVDDYLIKPLDIGVLLRSIRRTIEHNESKRELARLTEQMRAVNEHLLLSSARERKNANEAIRQRAQLDALLQNLSDGVVIADRQGRVLLANGAAHEMWLEHRPTANMYELNLLETLRIDGTPCPVEDRPLTRALRGEVFDRCEFLHTKADGSVRRFSTSGTNVRGADGNVELAIVVFRDVTELRRLERQRGDDIALISHDLRGPLSVIVLAAGTLRELARKTEQSEGALIVERLARNALRMNAMIAELMESAALDSKAIHLVKEPSNLGDIVNDILRDLDEASRRRIVFEAEGTVAAVLVEPAKIDRAITNLITNALKYSPNDSVVRLVLTSSGEQVVLEVVDQGIGISTAHLPRLFERYYRAPTGSGYSGLGLGLYITGQIVEAHGGRIEVVSEVGKGSRFTLFLPSDAPLG